MNNTRIFLEGEDNIQTEYDFFDTVNLDGVEYLVLVDIQNDYVTILQLGDVAEEMKCVSDDEYTINRVIKMFCLQNSDYFELSDA